MTLNRTVPFLTAKRDTQDLTLGKLNFINLNYKKSWHNIRTIYQPYRGLCSDVQGDSKIRHLLLSCSTLSISLFIYHSLFFHNILRKRVYKRIFIRLVRAFNFPARITHVWRFSGYRNLNSEYLNITTFLKTHLYFYIISSYLFRLGDPLDKLAIS